MEFIMAVFLNTIAYNGGIKKKKKEKNKMPDTGNIFKMFNKNPIVPKKTNIYEILRRFRSKNIMNLSLLIEGNKYN